MELPKNPKPATSAEPAARTVIPGPKETPKPLTPLDLKNVETKPTNGGEAPAKPNPFALTPEDFRQYLEFFDRQGKVDHIAILNDAPVRASNALKAVVDDNGWLPSLIVWAAGGKREAWDSAKDTIIAFIRVCDDVQKGMRAIYVLPDVKNWLNNGINWCCQTAWCMIFPDSKAISEEQKKALAVIEPLFQEWCAKFATPWWKAKRKHYSSMQAMLKDKPQFELAKESIAWLEENMADRIPKDIKIGDLAASFVLKFGDVAADLEKDLLTLLSKIERDKVEVPEEFAKDVRQITNSRIRDR